MLKFPGGKTRALTFSYDDGVSQDMRLVTLFNLYGLKGTFNLNSGIQSRENTWQNQDVLVRRMDPEVCPRSTRGTRSPRTPARTPASTSSRTRRSPRRSARTSSRWSGSSAGRSGHGLSLRRLRRAGF